VTDQAKTTDQVKESSQKANNRLENSPDAAIVRNASREQIDNALGQNPNRPKGMTEIAYQDGFVDSPDKRSMELLIAIDPQTGKELTIDKASKRREKDISLDPPPIGIMPAEGEAREQMEKQAKHNQLSQSAVLMAVEAAQDPRMKPVAQTRIEVDKLPPGELKDQLVQITRQEAAALSQGMRTKYERDGQLKAQYVGGTHIAITPEKLAGLPENTAEKTADGWLLRVNAAENVNTDQHDSGILEQIADLPLDKQAHVIGAGILAYQQEMRHQQFQIMVGTIAGVGDGAVNLAKGAEETAKALGEVWQFSREVMLNDPAAIEKAGKAGEVIGKILVGGVRLWQVSEAYLGDIGATGDYSIPLMDIAWLGEQVDQRWNAMTPADQSKLTAKLSTEYLGGLAASFGISKLAKNEKITSALEELGAAARELGGKSKEKAGKLISALLDDILPQPMAVTPDGQRIPIPRKERDNYLLSKADDRGDAKGKPPEGGGERGSIPEKFVASERFMAELQQAVDHLEPKIKQYLQEKGVEIKPCRRIVDVFPERKPNTMGCYAIKENRIYIAEEVQRSGAWVKNFDVDFNLRHESGHAFSYTKRGWEQVSCEEKFSLAFVKDIKNIPKDVLRTLDFEVGNLEGIEYAREEVFADSFAHATGCLTQNGYSKLIREYFPNCRAYFGGK